MRTRTYRYSISKNCDGVVSAITQLPMKSEHTFDNTDSSSYLQVMEEGTGAYNLDWVWISLIFIMICIIKITA
jgi:hypothetical protein